MDFFLAGCCQNEFDSTYPVHLNGIINQSEFVEAIQKINRTIFRTRARLAICAIYLLSIFISVLIILLGEARTVDTRAIVGGGLSIVGTTIFLILMRTMQYRQGTQMRAAVAEESRKYSTRSPTPCSWRLETTGFFGAWGNNNLVNYRVSILQSNQEFQSFSCCLFYS
jgi:formate hydrogenlyase subunit 3/multisubunit Na+/H+ antiporter MnhD subunit